MTLSLPRSAAPAPTVQQLDNGVTIIAEQMPVDAVNLSLWLNVGSAQESDDINGMAHYLEHMVFKGTDRLALGEFERLIEQRGGATNAATSQDYTQYYITTAPADFADLAPHQLDVVLNASIDDEAFERERSVILEEIRRSEDNPRRRLFYQAMDLTFAQLPYRRPVLGPTTVIEELQAQQMRDFHQHWYNPANLTAVVVGNLPTEKLIGILEAQFAAAPSRPRPRHSNWTPETPFTTVERQEVTDSSLKQARLMMTWRVPGADDLNATYPLDVIASILATGRTSRLVRDLREERGLVDQISVSNMTQALQGTFYVAAQCPTENIGAVETAITEHLQRLQDELVSETEVERVRTQVANRFIFSNESPSNRAGLYGYYHTVIGDLEPALDYPERIRSVSAAQMRQAAQAFLNPQAYGIVVMRPTEA
ncbi:pitrilysin family protein [Leptolyngbya sp. FACHB-261]|uniref:M16 family metallopeptidase n=1 Tax=Leptolyngbya sp. FACHB-261 TaxID=2692806 RepID=UPI0016854F1D|nr:pitrilysin family protein [Leptolyngbya sp. FACHB-261]MBD2105269.1 insulinase family protein [Leptolyngbya sp. FACHB-261]